MRVDDHRGQRPEVTASSGAGVAGWDELPGLGAASQAVIEKNNTCS